MFSPSLVQTDSSARRKTVDLARELGCVTSDPIDDGELVACLRAAPVQALNAAQTKVGSGLRTRSRFYSSDPSVCVLQLLAISGPFQSWSPLRQSVSQVSSVPGVDLLLGTSVYDGLIARASRIKVRGHG